MAGSINEARVALNSMQLLIEVIDDYLRAAALNKASVRNVKRATENRARNLLLVLKTEHARFVNTLAHVLKYRIGDVIKNMVEWDTPNLRATLKSTIGSSLGPFFSALRQLVACVREVERILKIDEYDKAPWSPRNPRDSIRRPWKDALKDPEAGFSIVAFEFRYREFLVATSDSKLVTQLSKMGKLNERIELLIWRSIRPPGNERLEFSQLKMLEKIRTCSSTVSRTLGVGSGFHCGCKSSHTAVLKLEDMIEQSTKIERSEPMRDEIRFSMVLNNSARKSRSPGWKWAEMVVKVLDPGKSHRISTAETSESELSDVAPAAEQRVKKKVVGFAKASLWFKGKSPETELATTLDLCRNISAIRTKALNSVNVLGDKQTGRLELDVQPTTTIYEAWSSLISFHGLLSAVRSGSRPTDFSIDQKLSLALKTSMSVLHLYQTPWLREKWTSNDILLIQSEDGKVLADAFVTHNIRQSSHDTPASSNTFSNVFEPTIFALGIFLIELSMEQPWEQIRRGAVKKIMKLDGEEGGTFMADLAAIDAIIRQATDEKLPTTARPFYQEGPFYLQAVRVCLLCELDGKASMRDTDFRQAVFEKVIGPLRLALEDYQYISSSETISLDSLPKPHSAEIETNFHLFDDKDARPEAPARADEWFDLYRNEVAHLLPDPPAVKTDRVKVALFDTGLDPTDAVIRRHLGRITYKSFVPGEEYHTVKNAKDDNGHGTHCAALLLKVAKTAEVFIGRVTTGKQLESSEYISQAIEWAINEKVDLISMSFGFPRYSPALTEIQSSIVSAYQNGIIMFAAASNGGGNSGLAYPANQNEVICIGASDGKGNKSDFTPGPYPDVTNFTTLGEGVTSSWPRALDQERTKIMSGTSVATPIAVGIAAMVVGYLRALPQHEYDNFDFLMEQKLRSKKGMNAVLKKLTEERDGFMYIAPWILFCEDRKEGVAQILLDALRNC